MPEELYSNLTPKELIGRLVNDHANMLADSIFSHPHLPDHQKQLIQVAYKKYSEEECRKDKKQVDNPNLDISLRLRFIIYHWDEFQPAFKFKSVSKSYLYLIIFFRNEWAHNIPISNDEVVYAANTVIRLAHIIQDFNVIRDVGSMIEYIDSKKAMSIIDEYVKNNPIREITEEAEYQLYDSIDSTESSTSFSDERHEDVDTDDNVEIITRLIPDELGRQAFDAILFDEFGFFFELDHGYVYETLYPTFFKNLSEFELEHLEDCYPLLVNKIREDIAKDLLEREGRTQVEQLNDKGEIQSEEDEEETGEEDSLIGSDGRSNCSEGKYPDTLFFSSDSAGFALGSYKLTLLLIHISVLEKFINNELLDRKYIDYYKGNPVVCIPSVQDAEIKMGKNKAQIILDNQKNIFRWLHKNNKLTFLEEYLRPKDG